MRSILGTRRLAQLAGAVLVVGPALVAAPAASAAPVLPDGTWWYDAIGVADAQAQATGEGVTIALVDTMIDTSVPDLAGADVVPVANFCRVPYKGEPDFYDAVPDPDKVVVQSPAADHATSMAALMVGTGRGNGPGGAGVRGVAPDATVRVYSTADNPDGSYECGGDGRSGAVAVAASIDQAIRDDVDIINISLGASGAIRLQSAAVADAVAAGIVVVGAAGNSGTDIGDPVGPGAVSVVGVAQDGGLTDSSSYGIDTMIASPGQDIACGAWTPSGWDSAAVSDGTSQSAAIVSGALALVKSKYPQATGNQLVQHLIRNTTSDQLEWNEQLGFGIFSIDKMLAADPAMWADVNPILEVDELVSYVVEDYPNDAALASAQETATPSEPPPDPEPERPDPAETEPSDEVAAGTPSAGDGSSGLLVPGLVAGVLAAAAGAALLHRRQRSRAAGPTADRPPGGTSDTDRPATGSGPPGHGYQGA